MFTRRSIQEANCPETFTIFGMFSPNTAANPTTVAANGITTAPGSAAANAGWGPAGFGPEILSIVHTSTGLYTITFANVGKYVVGVWAELVSDDATHTYWAQASAVVNLTNKTWIIRTLQSSGAVPGAAVVDVPATSNAVISFGVIFQNADYPV